MNVLKDFPILKRTIHGQPLCYLDNAATTHKPQSVIDAITRYYENENSNVHRGAHLLSQEATDLFENVRRKTASFLGAKESEIVFTKGTTEAINLVMQSWGREQVHSGDRVLVTRMEHHSNFVPWQQLAKQNKAEFVIVELNSEFRIDWDSLNRALSEKPKILAITYASNVLGTINPIREIATMAKEKGCAVLVDAAQAAPQMQIRVQDLGPIDFLAFSAHKMCGPTGMGVLWVKEEVLEKMPAYQYGGGMILNVRDDRTLWAEGPARFEAGTPHVAGVAGLGAALDYLEKVGLKKIEAYKSELAEVALEKLLKVSGLKLLGPRDTQDRAAVFSFTLDGVHPHDLATFLDQKGIAVRAGHHCAQPLGQKFGVPASTRASFYITNQKEDVDLLVRELEAAKKYFGG